MSTEKWLSNIHVVNVDNIVHLIHDSFVEYESRKQVDSLSLSNDGSFCDTPFDLPDKLCSLYPESRGECVHRACCSGLMNRLSKQIVSAKKTQDKSSCRKRRRGVGQVQRVKNHRMQLLLYHIHLPPFLQAETWLRHNLSIEEVVSVMSAFTVQELWTAASFHDIKISNSAIKRSEESQTSLIFSCKSIVLSKLKKLVVSTMQKSHQTKKYLKWFALGKKINIQKENPDCVVFGTVLHEKNKKETATSVASDNSNLLEQQEEEEEVVNYCCADSVLRYFAHYLHVPFCPVHRLIGNVAYHKLASALDNKTSVEFLEKTMKFAQQTKNTRVGEKTRNSGSNKIREDTSPNIFCCDSMSYLENGAVDILSRVTPTKTPLSPCCVVDEDKTDTAAPQAVKENLDFFKKQSVAKDRMQSMWKASFATWNVVFCNNLFWWRGIFFAPMCVRNNFIRCSRVVPLLHYVESQVCKNLQYPTRPHVEMPTLVCTYVQEKKMWWVALEETFYFFY